MQRYTPIDKLKASIFLLEIKHADEGRLLKEQFKVTYESLKPASLIKLTLKELGIEPGLKKDTLNIIISLAARYISKKTFIYTGDNPIRKIIFTFLQMAASGIDSPPAEAQDI